MKIDRKKLLEGLKVATKITPGKSTFPILACVLIDGPGQQLVATDLETTGFIPLEISDYTRTMPAEEVEEDLLEGLKGPQLKNLAQDYGIVLPDGKKPTVAVLRETIMAACQSSAKEKTEWQEKFCKVMIKHSGPYWKVHSCGSEIISRICPPFRPMISR